MMQPHSPSKNLELISELHRRQARMYAGESVEPVLELLAREIVWHVPGRSPIAGDYRGHEAVLAYFSVRRELAAGTMRMHPGQAIADEEAVAQLVAATALLDGEEVQWRTVGVYRISAGKIAEVWLVPLDLDRFNQVWTPASQPFRYTARVRPQECNDGGVLGHPRLLEHLEAAFIEWWRSIAGPLASALAPGRRLTLSSVEARFEAPVHSDALLIVGVRCEHGGETSLEIGYEAQVGKDRVAVGTSRYVCVDSQTGRPTPWPPDLADRFTGSRSEAGG